jgi:HK97 family phage portal protein
VLIKLRNPIQLLKRSTLANPASWMYNVFGNQTKSGEHVNEERALRLAAVDACVRIISTAIAKSPKYLYMEDAEGNLIHDKGNPLYFILSEQPTELYNKFNYDKLMLTYRLLWGNAYAYIHRNRYNEPEGLTVLYPWAVKPRFQSGKLYYQNTDTRYPEIPTILQPYELIHLKNISTNGYEGKSPIALHAETLGVTIASESYGAKFFGNSGIPSGFLQVPGPLNPQQAKLMKENWESQVSGEQSQSTAVLGSGAKYERLTIPPEEAQFLDTRKYGVREIAAIYGVPLHMLGDLERATFSNIEHQSIQFVSGTLTEYSTEIEWEEECKLLTKEQRMSHEIRYDFAELLKGDAQSVMNYAKDGLQNGIFSINEVRKMLGKNNVEGGDQRFINLQMLPIEQVSDFHMAQKGIETKEENKEIIGFIQRELNKYHIMNKANGN